MHTSQDRRIIYPMSNTIAMLTDFGMRDPFVGIMKGVIGRINPQATMIDLSHQIPPGDIRQGAVALWQAQPYFPSGTVWLAVVDPGVGTRRRGMIAQSGGQIFVGPDNGVFSFALNADAQVWELSNPDFALPGPRMTFHGRDIFSPGAAHASLGIAGPEFGAPLSDWMRLPVPKLDTPAPGQWRGEILHADHFGNLLTSLGCFFPFGENRFALHPWLRSAPATEVDFSQIHVYLPDGRRLPWANTFGEIPPGQCAALIGSSGLVEIAANQQSAADSLGLDGGEEIILSK